MNRPAFFSTLRQRDFKLFGTSLSQGQVNGLETILTEAEKRKTPLKWLAYMLATVYHECGGTMQPIRERGGPKYFARYEGRKDLGNVVKGDGVKFHGRGFVQITGRRNYTDWARRTGVDLVKEPDKALDLSIATRILFEGMEKGTFTGKSLSSYTDYLPMRRIINGTDKASLIAGYAEAFEKALRNSGYGQWVSPNPSVPELLKEEAAKPIPAPAIRKSLLASIIAFILSLFKKG